MSSNNGVIKIGRKGTKKFAFGEDGKPFEVDVVAAFQEWLIIDEGLRGDGDSVKTEDVPTYQEAAVDFVTKLSGEEVTRAEALDFLARLCEQYNEIASFFQPKLPEKRGSPATTASEVRFSVEENLARSMN